MALVEFATPSEILNITEENNFFLLTFFDQRVLNSMGMENTAEMCSDDIACDKYKDVIRIRKLKLWINANFP